MKSKVFKETRPMMIEAFGEEVTAKALTRAMLELDRLASENKDEPKAVRPHTIGKIYPCISMYIGLQEAGVDKDKALAFLDMSHSKRAEKQAKAMRSLCKLPGVCKKMPAIFKSVTVKQFGLKQGFQYKFYDTEKTRCKFDMTKCLYCDVCKRCGYPELVKCFCHTDDVTDGNIHPRLKWNRTKTMGEGGDVCDFDLYLVEADKK